MEITWRFLMHLNGWELQRYLITLQMSPKLRYWKRTNVPQQASHWVLPDRRSLQRDSVSCVQGSSAASTCSSSPLHSSSEPASNICKHSPIPGRVQLAQWSNALQVWSHNCDDVWKIWIVPPTASERVQRYTREPSNIICKQIWNNSAVFIWSSLQSSTEGKISGKTMQMTFYGRIWFLHHVRTAITIVQIHSRLQQRVQSAKYLAIFWFRLKGTSYMLHYFAPLSLGIRHLKGCSWSSIIFAIVCPD